MSICDVTRRDFLFTSLAVRAALAVPAPPGVEFRARSVVVNGKPVFLVAGTLDYFRCPHQLWRDILLRAKRAGLNTISFYIAWNFHETEEGKVDFSGDRDIGHFLDLCAELGLAAWPRFGPFICAEWEAGGYPAWLLAKPGVELRTVNEPGLGYLRRWMEHVIPIIVPRQATRGGPVILIQQENEYFFVGRSGVRAYQEWLIRNMRELGIQVPITDCNGTRPETRVPGSFLTLNGGGEGNVRTLEKAHPGQPAIISEHYTDYMNCWGWPVSSYPTATMLRQQTIETLATGGLYTYFTFYGGTNFGYWAGTTWKSDQSFVTTRYFARSPINEGGAFNESYFAAKAINLLAVNFQEFLTSSEDAPLPINISGPVRANAFRSSSGYLLFVQPRFSTHVSSIYHTDDQGGPFIQLGEEWPLPEMAEAHGALEVNSSPLPLAESASYTSMLPYQLQIDGNCRIDYANATLLGRLGASGHVVLLFRGEAGAAGVVSVNNNMTTFTFPPEDPLQLQAAPGVVVLALSPAAADRAWFTGNRVVIGPAYVGEERAGQHQCFLDGRTTSITTVSADGSIETRPVKPGVATAVEIPLTEWTSHPLPELQSSATSWRALDTPRPVEELGAYLGYCWYRAAFRCPQAAQTELLLTGAADRVHVFVNGRKGGVWGRGAGAVRDPLPIHLQAGENRFVFLCDNMGRLSEGAVLDHKGIYGPAFLQGRIQELGSPQWSVPDRAPTQSWQFQTFRHYSPEGKLRRAAYGITAKEGEGMQISLRWFPQYAWIALNGHVIAEHAGDLSLAGGVDFNSAILDPYLTPGRTQRLEITLFGAAPVDFEKHVRLLVYPHAGRLENWEFRPWSDPEQSSSARVGEPVWWETQFGKPAAPGPFFLVMQDLSKGQAYINGHALGRYWEIGPQHSLYVPEPWLARENRLMIFDEEGRRPDHVYLLRDSRVPTESIWI